MNQQPHTNDLTSPAESEHRRHSLPAHDVVGVDVSGAHCGVVGVGVGRGEPDTSVDADRLPLSCRNQRDRGRRTGRRHLDPAHALAHGGVHPRLETEPTGVELERSILIGHRMPTVLTSVMRVVAMISSSCRQSVLTPWTALTQQSNRIR